MVGQHPAFINSKFNPFNHAAIILIPDNPDDFRNDPLFNNSNIATLGAQAFGSGFKKFFALFGGLRGVENYSGDCPNNLKDQTEVKTPKGMTDTEFINALINGAASYKGNIIYDPTPALGPYGVLGYNSNSYVSGLINAAGGVAPKLPGIQPGYNYPLPIKIMP